MLTNLSLYQNAPVETYPNSVSQNPLVSVLVQTYQHANYIAQCLDGILMQKTNFSFEVLVGEDESSDGTRDICIEYAKKHPDKIKLFLHSRENVLYLNNKPTGRFNLLWNLSNRKGKYFAFCEGDDYWTDPNKLQKQVDFLEANPDYSICFHKATIRNERISPAIESPQNIDFNKYTFDIKFLLTTWNIPTASLLIKLPDNFFFPEWTNRVGSADIALVALVFKHGKVGFIDQNMSVYRLHGGGISLQHVNYFMVRQRLFLYEKLNEYFDYKFEKEISESIKYIIDRFSVPKKKSFLREIIKRIPYSEYLYLKIIDVLKGNRKLTNK